MEVSAVFTAQWQRLLEERNQIVNEAEKAKQQLAALLDDPSITQMMQQKDSLEKEVLALWEYAGDCKELLEKRTNMVRNCNTVLSGKATRKDLRGVFKRFLASVEKARKKAQFISRPEERFTNEMKQAADWPPETILTYFTACVENEKEHIRRIEASITATKTEIATIKENFRSTKNLVEQEVSHRESAVTAHRQAMLEWGSQDRQHLEWVFSHAPEYSQDVLYLYQQRFPAEDTSQFTSLHMATSEKRLPQRPRQRESEPELPQLVEDEGGQNKPWEFFIARKLSDPGTKISIEKDSFLREMQPWLRGDLSGLRVGALHERLSAIIKMSLQQRQTGLTKIIEEEFHGWQRIRIGGYRIVILIEEKPHHITFVPFKKGNESYVK